MALVHNCFIRGLNCIYLQAPNVKEPKDISDFTTFMHAWIFTLHEHHGNEEKFFFPHVFLSPCLLPFQIGAESP